MRRLLFQTTMIQSLGTLLMLGITLLVSRLGGPGTQGSFALVKSFNDLQVAIFSLGLPPAIVIMLNRTGRGHRAVERLTLRYGLALVALLPFVTLGSLLWTGTQGRMDTVLLQAALIGFGSALFTTAAFLRALLLVHTDGPVFSLISIVHWVVIFIVAVTLLNRTDLIFEIAYSLAGLGTVALTYWAIRNHRPAGDSQHRGTEIDWQLLRSQSGQVLTQAVLYGLQPFVTNALLTREDPSLVSAGLFNIAGLVITLPNLLVALVAPVLLNRWSKGLDARGLAQVRTYALLLGIAGQVAALVLIPALPLLIGGVFGDAFQPAVMPTSILMLSVLAVISGRILTPALQGVGRNHLVSWSCGARICAISICTAAAVAVFGQSLLLALAVGWCAGEYAALAVLIGGTRAISGSKVSAHAH